MLGWIAGGGPIARAEPRLADEPWFSGRQLVQSPPVTPAAQSSRWFDVQEQGPIDDVETHVLEQAFQTSWYDPWAATPPEEDEQPWSNASAEWQRGAADWTWQVLPNGLMYRAYMAGVKESRFSTAYLYSRHRGWVWDSTLGGQVGVLRFGSEDAVQPEGFQLDLEGAVFTRLDVESKDDLESADFRVGFPLTWSQDGLSLKFGYYHFSSHLGDEFMLRHPTVPRINYVRDGLLLGASWQLSDALRAYSEAGWAFKTDGGAKPWEFHFGAEYSPAPTRPTGPAPYTAVHANLRQEVGFGGNINVIAGWQWKGQSSARLWRIGLQYFNGKSSQYAFFRRSDQLAGMGLWFDY